jgi:hypothetical protein
MKGSDLVTEGQGSLVLKSRARLCGYEGSSFLAYNAMYFGEALASIGLLLDPEDEGDIVIHYGVTIDGVSIGDSIY